MSKSFTIQLNNGLNIDLRSLKQQLTYEGLLEGLPTTQMNKRIIEGILKDAILPYREGKPYLIEPVETAIEYRRGEQYPFGNPAALPGVVCEARFHCFQPARDTSLDYSWLIVVWFQERFAMPIDQDIEERIKAIDWNNVANDDEY